MRRKIKQPIEQTILSSGILCCFLCFSISCEKIDDKENIKGSSEIDNTVSFLSTNTDFLNDKEFTKGGDKVTALPCIPATWGQVSVDVYPVNCGIKTKGIPISSATNISDAGVFAYYTEGNFNSSSSTGSLPNFMYNQKITQAGGVWSYTPKKYWPLATDSRVSFFVYSPFASVTNGLTPSAGTIMGTPYINYTMPTSVSNQPDLLVAPIQANKVKADGPINFPFIHAFAYVGFSIQGDNNQHVVSIGIKGISVSGTLSMDGTTVTWSNLGTATTSVYTAGIVYDLGQNYVTATSTQVAVGTLMKTDGYLMAIPQTLTASSKIVVSFSDGSTRELAINTGSAAWVAGNKYIYNITISSALAPSNSYILSPNTTSAKRVLISAIDRVNHFWASAAEGGFKNADGDGFIELGNLDTNVITSTDKWYFEVIWADFAQSTNVTITQRGAANNVYGTGTNEKLELTLAAGTYTGNMLIGVKKQGGTDYLWSFHLWITTYDPSLTANQITLQSNMVAMDRDLGATSNDKTSINGFGLKYQWGRKDPFLPPSTKSNSASPKTPTTGNISVGAQFSGTLLNSISNPNVFYPGNNTSAVDWNNNGGLNNIEGFGFNRWGGAASNIDKTVTKNSKTIYDPCPTGWRVPWGTNFMGYTHLSSPATFVWDAVNFGRLYTGNGASSFFSASGMFLGYTGALTSTNIVGFWWSSAVNATSDQFAIPLAVNPTNVGTSGIYTSRMADGYCVRPVVDN